MRKSRDRCEFGGNRPSTTSVAVPTINSKKNDATARYDEEDLYEDLSHIMLIHA